MATIDQTPEGVLAFWFEDDPTTRREKWFEKNLEFDAEIGRRFGKLHEMAMAGGLDDWAATPSGRLALVIVLDQFSRNMFRDDPSAFAGDAPALALAKAAVASGEDRELGLLEREFLYLPYEHSEDLADQRRSVELFAETGAEGLDYAKRHLDVIERFGRFPHRNKVLGRANTAAEAEYLEDPDSGF